MNKSAYTKIFLTLSFFILIGFKSQAQYQNNWALGLKVGEPLALNIRKYFSYGDRAFDLNIGSYGFLMGRVRNYRKDPLYDKTGIGIQGLYHYLNTLGKRERIHYYYGYGAHFNFRDKIVDNIGVRDKYVRQFSIGPAVNAGIEIAIPENDLAVFLDLGGYMELAPSPLFVHPQANVGIRLNLIK